MTLLNLEPAAFLLSLFCLVYSLTVNKRRFLLPKGLWGMLQDQHFMFLVVLTSNLVSAASSVAGAALIPYASAQIVGWQYFLHVCYFFAHSTLSLCFALYIMAVNGATIGRDRTFFIGYCFPYLISEIMVLTNSFTGFAFRMDENFVYHRGTLIPLLYLIGLGYFVSGFIFFFRYKKAISTKDGMSIGIMMMLSAVGVVIQAFRSDFAVELFCESLTFLGMMMMLEDRRSHADPLTGALNRNALVDANRRLIENDRSYQLVLVKLSNMHEYLRMFNGKTMAELQRQIIGWLSSFTSEQNFYCFREGDFVLLYPDASIVEVGRNAEQIVERFKDDWKSGDEAYKLEVMVTLIRVPEDVSTLGDLMGTLDFGYSRAGIGSRLVPFDEISAFHRDRRVEQALRDALKNNRLQICFRPILSVVENRVVAAEGVLFVDHDLLRGLPADMYLTIAVQCGLIWDLGIFAFEGICRFAGDGLLERLGLSYLELRIPSQHFMYEDVVSEYEKVRAKYGVPTSAIRMEFMVDGTEGDASAAGLARETMRALGYSFSFGDFGSGYLDLSHLLQGNYNNIRIGKSLLWDAGRNEDLAQMLASMVGLVRERGYSVLVDGVETPEQLALAKRIGADFVEGRQISGPLSAEEMIRFMEEA